MSTHASGSGPGALLGSGISALAGGSLAVAVLHVFDLGPGVGIELLLVFLAAVVAITITWFIPLTRRTASPSPGPAGLPPPGAAAHTFQPGPPVPPFAPPPARHDPVASLDTTSTAIPATLDIPLDDAPWWNSAVSASDAGTAGAAGTAGTAGVRAGAARGPSPSPAPAAANVAVRDQPRQVAQCPQCGDFRVDVHHRAPGFDLACTRCGHRWFWQAGTPWPRTVVHPQ